MTDPILILGATSGIGKCAVEEALSRGLPVRAFSRSADKIPLSPNLETFAGDALLPGDIAGAVKGVRAIVYALGIRERLAMLWEDETLFSASTSILLEQMGIAGVTRLAVVTGYGAGRSKIAMSLIERAGFQMVFRKPYQDKDRQEAMILESDTDWTIARPGMLTNGAYSGKYKILRSPKEWRLGMISRRDVASYLIDTIEKGSELKSDVVLVR